MPIERRWLKVAEAGEYLGLHPKSIYRSCRQRNIPFTRQKGVGVRIDKRELDSLLERQSINSREYGKMSVMKKAKG